MILTLKPVGNNWMMWLQPRMQPVRQEEALTSRLLIRVVATGKPEILASIVCLKGREVI